MSLSPKVASTGRFGSRYGVGIRRKLLKVEPLQLLRHACPNCGSAGVKRNSRGIFECRKCTHTFVGGAYLPQTLAGTIISKMVMQKTFAPEMVETLTKLGADGAPEKGAVEEAKPEGKHHKEKKAHKHEEAKAEETEEVEESVEGKEEADEDLGEES